jgi:hypothetical protein
MTADIFCFYLQSRLIQTSQTGGQPYSDISPLSIPWIGAYFIGLSILGKLDCPNKGRKLLVITSIFLPHKPSWFFSVKRVPGRGPEQRESGKTVVNSNYYID